MFESKIASLLGMIGSVFVQRGTDGKVAVAVGPWAVVAVSGLILGCGVQNAEPFSQCVTTIGNYLMGV